MRRNGIIIVSLILLLLVTASILFLRSAYFSSLIERRIIPLVEDSIGRKIEFSASHISIFPFHWQLHNAVLRDIKTGDVLLMAKDVRVYVNLSDLDLKTLVIKDIRLSEPVLSVIKYPDGKTNLEGLFPPRKPTGWLVMIDKVDVTQGRILYNDQLTHKYITLYDLNARIMPDLIKKEVRGDFTAKGDYKDPRISQQDLKIKGDAAIDIKDRKVRTVKVKGLNITSPGGSKLQADGVIGGTGSIDINGDVILSLADITRYIPGKKDLQGKIRFTGGVKGSFNQPVVKGSVTMDNLSYDRIRYGKLKGDLSLKEGILNLSNLKGEVLNGRIEGDIEMDYREKIPAYHVLLRGGDLRPDEVIARYLYSLRERLGKDGIISAEIEAWGSGFDKETWEGKGQLTYKDSSQSFALSGKIKKDLVARAEITGELTDIATYLHIPRFPLHGFASLTGDISGPIDKPVISGTVRIPKGTVNEITFDSITADLRLSDGTLDLQSVTLRSGDAAYSMSGSIQFRSPGFKEPYFDLSGDMKQGSPKDIVTIFYRTLPLDMKTDGHIKFSGDARDLRLVAELEGSPGSIYGQTFDGGGHIDLTLTRERIIFDSITMKQGKDIVTGVGWIGFGGEYKGNFYTDISSEGFSIENVDLLKDRLSSFKGTAAFKMTGSGRLIDPAIEATIEIPHLFVKDADTGLARLSVSKDRDEMKIGGEALNVQYNGNIPWNRESPFTLNIHLEDSRLNPLLALLKPSAAQEVFINASGEIVIEGILKEPRSLHAGALLSHVTGLYGDYRVENDGDIRLSFAENRLTLDSVRFKGEGTSLGMIGSLIPHGDINVFINGEADLRLLTLLTPEIKYSKGKAFVAFLVSGEMENPSIQGGLAVKDGTIRSATLRQTLEDANLSVFFNGREMVLESMHGVVGGGTVNGSGKVEIREFEIKEFGFVLEIADAIFRYPEGLETRIDGTLIFQGTPKSKGLKGEIRIRKASYEKNMNLRSMVVDFQRKRAKIEQPVPFFGNTELNIHIAGKKEIWINNNLAKIPVEVDLILKGTIDHPLLFGRIEAQDGTFVFSRSPFKVISATADFISPDTIRPVLDVHATTDIRGYKIDLRLSGTMERFNLTLNSDPALSDTDILALLTVGQTSAEAAETAKAIGTVEATAFLAAPIQEKIENTLQGIIKIDRFQVDPYYSSSTASEGVRLTVGKRLLDERLYVTYTTGITTVEELIKLEYFLGKNVYIVGERDEQGRMSGDIKFRFEFR